MHKNNTRVKTRLALALLCVVAGCGGGASTGHVSISGRVIDGYVRGATVFWDCNGNNSLDPDEVSAITGAGGVYHIDDNTSIGCRLLAKIDYNSVDEDNPLIGVGREYVLEAVRGLPVLITPYTTIAAAKIATGEVTSPSDASDKIAQELGLSGFGNLLVDYKVSSSPKAVMVGAAAKVLVNEFQSSGVYSSTSVELAYKSVKDGLNLSGVRESLALGVQPFFYNPFSLVGLHKDWYPVENKNNIVLRSKLLPNQKLNDLFDQIAAKTSQSASVKYGRLGYDNVSTDVIKNWVQSIDLSQVNDPSVVSLVNKYRSDRQLALNSAGDKYRSAIDDATAFSNLCFGDVKACADFVLDVTDASINVAADFGSVATMGGGGAFLKSFRYLQKKNSLGGKFIKFAEKVGALGSVGQCAVNWSAIWLDGVNGKDVDGMKVASAASDCMSAAVGVVKDLKKLKKYKSVKKALEAGVTLDVFTVDVITDGSDEDKEIALTKVAVDVFDAFKDIAGILDDSGVNGALAFVDTPLQYLKARLAGLELANKAGQVMDDAAKNAAQNYAYQVFQSFSSYYRNYLGAFGGYFSVVDKNKVPYIISSVVSVDSSGGYFVAVQGFNLPPQSMSANLNGILCGDVSNGVDRVFSCPKGNYPMQSAFVVRSGGIEIPSPLLLTMPAISKLPDTGITASQCYAAGSNTLVSCTSAAAIALNDKQDGMVGRDVSSPSNTDGKLGFSYSTVGSYTKEECVKDNITGLTWEGKPTSGLRAASNTYTNYGDNSASDASTYVAAVNAAKLCGYTDWRLPTFDELLGIVDDSVAYPGPTIDSTWFPNTQQSVYWTGTGYAGDSSYAWYVYFSNGGVNYSYRYDGVHVRLVR